MDNTVVALFGRFEETVREVRRCIRLRIASAWETGLRHRNSSSGYDLHDPLEEKIAEVEKLFASEDGEPEYVRAKTGLVETESVFIPVQIIVGSVFLPVGQLIEESAVLGLEERHGQIGYVILAGVFGKVVEVC